ncbi:MAG: 1-acyl-sn-glycerol-3-phosphate acyltransferase [Bacteroidales bacterium]|nr:1-acyl-sn-glycerol-3-phosphate acyltransferase [Bacteroidales bacterium]
MAELWEKDRLYSFLRPWVDWCTRRSFSSLKVQGALSQDGRAVIVAPNHCNTLMDALVVLQAQKEPMAFGARADIFRKPSAAKALGFLKILPIARKRDGLRSVAQNLEIIPVIQDVLHHGMPFCIFPEGRHRPMYSLLPIHKGVVRIALKNAAHQPTCIVPTGLYYSNFFHYRGTCEMRYGKPIDVSEFVASHSGLSKPELYKAFSAELSRRISELMLFIPDDENYETRLAELRPPRKRRWWDIPLAICGMPVFVVSALLSLPLWCVAEYICHFKIKDKAFCNSVRFLVRLVGEPLFFLLWAIAAFLLLPPLGAAGLLALYAISYSVFYDWLNLVNGRL